MKLSLVCFLIAFFCGCSSFSGSTHAVPSADFLAVQETRDTIYMQSRADDHPFDGSYYHNRDSSFASVKIDSVYWHALDVDVLRGRDSIGALKPDFFLSEKGFLIGTYQILGGHH